MKTKYIVLVFILFSAFGSASRILAQETKRVAIFETVDKENKFDYDIEFLIRSKMRDAISSTPGFEGYDRVDTKSIMNEHEFQRSGLVSAKDIKKVGEMTGADFILINEVASMGNYIIIVSTITEVESGNIWHKYSEQTPKDYSSIEKSCKKIAGKLLLPSDSKKNSSNHTNIWEGISSGTGRGDFDLKDGTRYVGEYKDGKPHGYGFLLRPTGWVPASETDIITYEGDWINGKKEGKGNLKFANGDRYEGEFKDDQFHGKGTYTWKNGDYEKCTWINGVKNGETEYHIKGNGYWIGNYKNGEKKGKWKRMVDGKVKETKKYK